MTDAQSDYLMAWCIYLLAVVGAMVVLRHLTVALKLGEFATVIKLCVLVLLVTPAQVDAETNAWAPAFMAVLMDAISGETEQVISRLLPILLIMLLVLMLSFLWRMVNRKS